MSFNSPVIFFYFFASGALSAAPISSSFTANFIKTRGATAMKKLIAAIALDEASAIISATIYIYYILHTTRRDANCCELLPFFAITYYDCSSCLVVVSTIHTIRRCAAKYTFCSRRLRLRTSFHCPRCTRNSGYRSRFSNQRYLPRFPRQTQSSAPWLRANRYPTVD